MGLFGGSSRSSSTVVNETSNVTQGVQEGGVAINVQGGGGAGGQGDGGAGPAVTFTSIVTDNQAVENALNFAEQSQAYVGESFASVIGLAENQNESYFRAFDELQQSQQNIYEQALESANRSQDLAVENIRALYGTALESANRTRDLAFENIGATTGKIASIAQTTTGDIKPIITTALVGLSVLFVITKVLTK